METNTRHRAPAVPRHRHGCIRAGQSVSPDIGAKLKNETVERTRQLTVDQVGYLLRAPLSRGYGDTRLRGQRRMLGSGLGKYRPLVRRRLEENRQPC